MSSGQTGVVRRSVGSDDLTALAESKDYNSIGLKLSRVNSIECKLARRQQ
jgi:hypothetical protein